MAQFKAVNEGSQNGFIYFFNLDRQFQRYLHFSVPKKGVFVDKS